MDLSERGTATSRHPWEIERFRAYRRVLADHGALAARRVLDVGAGDGWFSQSLLADLPHAEQVVCWDINYNELELTTDDRRLVRTADPPTPGFDLVLLLDVLEHIPDPARFIEHDLRRLTSAGTAALVAVPAHPALFGSHDRALRHHRRYTAQRLLDEVAPWIEVVDHGPLFPSLVAPRAAGVALERARARIGNRRGVDDSGNHGVGEWHHGPTTTRLVRGMLALDSGATHRFPNLGRRLTGLSHWAFGLTR
ncbi:MAG TPA: methyltransferase domain-containing protein [Ilumatobacter sp.]|nr:methyltransferase domain-containing protein [Ilumatobacter sp.]